MVRVTASTTVLSDVGLDVSDVLVEGCNASEKAFVDPDANGNGSVTVEIEGPCTDVLVYILGSKPHQIAGVIQ